MQSSVMGKIEGQLEPGTAWLQTFANQAHQRSGCFVSAFPQPYATVVRIYCAMLDISTRSTSAPNEPGKLALAESS